MLLPDVNVWLALAFDFHSHHAAANIWYEGSSEPCAFCRWTQQGFLRLATNPMVFKEDAVSLKQAWRMYDMILSDPRITFAGEPEGHSVVNRHMLYRQSTCTGGPSLPFSVRSVAWFLPSGSMTLKTYSV